MNKFHRWFCKTDFWKKALADEVLPWALKGIELGDHILEVGPGHGLTTDILGHQKPRMTSIEIDPRLGESLRLMRHGTNVTVVGADATSMPCPGASCTGPVSFT